MKSTRGTYHAVTDDGFLVEPIVITVDLSDIIELDLEGFLDLISELAGFPLMMAQEYTIVGYEPQAVRLSVTGDVSAAEDGTSGQDRDNYTDTQDRDNYVPET